MKITEWRRFATDETGSTEFVGLVLVTSLVAIGGLVGMTVIRDQVTQEFGDIAVALDNVDQSFSYLVTVNAVPVWQANYDDPAPTLLDPADSEPACLVIGSAPPGAEGSAFPQPTGAFP